MHLKKGNGNAKKVLCETNFCDLTKRIEQREKELNDLKNYVKVLEELFQRTRERQQFIPIESASIIETIRPSHN